MENIPREYFAQLVARQKTNAVILTYLEMDFDIVVCERTLKRWLQKHNIRRHDAAVSARRVINAIEDERRGPRRHCGIRYLHFALRNKHELLVTRDQVSDVCAWLDPATTVGRQGKAPWNRRLLYCPGPNYRWCIDGYDKLSKFGIYIHGAIDEYSRSLLWLEVNVSNRLPDLIVRYYLRAVQQKGVAPEYVSSDFGHEADLVAACQTYLFSSDSYPASHHRWNYSITNTTIEAYWRQHRQRSAQYWIDRLTVLEERSLWDGNAGDQLALWAIYLPLIRADLTELVDYHNGHRIRSQPDRLRPSGIPEDLYLFSERYGGRPCGRVVTPAEINLLCTEIRLDGLEIPYPIPEKFRLPIELWFMCNGIHVTMENADEMYMKARTFFMSLLAGE